MHLTSRSWVQISASFDNFSRLAREIKNEILPNLSGLHVTENAKLWVTMVTYVCFKWGRFNILGRKNI